jgi:hypothetical protein
MSIQIISSQRATTALMNYKPVFKPEYGSRRCNESETSNGLTPDKRLVFKDYEVDVEEEPCVFGGLTSMLLKTLLLFLANLRALASGWSWGTHVLMVDAVEKRVFALLRVTISCGGRVEVD